MPGAEPTVPSGLVPDQTTPLEPAGDPTLPLETAPSPRPEAPALSTPGLSASRSGGRFVAGDLLKGRYRIMGLLGKGGMGEVYRAEDLKLQQDVALKFLPRGLERDPGRLQMFLNEVRTARQVTHPNVCRVYDVEENDGQHFLSMEYVDGEDLATSLRRTGRLPEERAVPVARQICAGLAAAHDQGILHRDLKPANVMIDGRGRVKLTDFGLAGLAEAFAREDARAGTPAYMSPEQISGREVTARSDIYGLGLVLYELFTGRPPFRADSMAEYQTLHNESVPSNPTQHVPGLDPVVEQAIMRCLAKVPEQRPASPLAVSAALPGGDPLAAALAAGETPSPELMAEAGRRPGLAPVKAWALAGLAILLMVGGAHWAARNSLLEHLPLDKRPEVLVDRAQEMLAAAGYVEDVYSDPVDQAWGFISWNDVIQDVGSAGTSRSRWDALRERPDAGGIWYRQSPRILKPAANSGPIVLGREVSLTNPQQLAAGEATVVLDLAGRLRRLEVTPRRFAVDEPSEPDWSSFFAAAELDTARFTPVRPRYQRYIGADIRRAWTGSRAANPDIELRVEAQAWEGRPVLFNVATPEGLAVLANPPERQVWGVRHWLLGVLQPLVILIIIIAATRTGQRNTESARIDKLGAARFASLVFVLFLLGEGLGSHTIFTPIWGDEIWPIIVGAVFTGSIAWALYVAAEPLGRRIWPTMFVSASRLLSQPTIPRRDPLIGQSILVALIGAGAAFLFSGPLRWEVIEPLLGKPATMSYVNVDVMMSQRLALGLLLNQSMLIGFQFLHIMALVLIRFLVKKPAVAVVLTLAVWTLLSGPGNPTAAVVGLLNAALSLAILLRWGVVAFIVQRMALHVLWNARPLDLDSWFSQGSLILMGALVAMALYGGWAAVGDARSRPLSES